MGCHNATILTASADTVWNALRDFHDLSWSSTVVEKVTPVGDATGTEIGAKRVLNDAFHETLRELDDEARYIRYSIDDGPGPVAKDAVSGYIGEVRVLPITVPDTPEQCVVVWTSHWESESGGVHELCNPIYRALMVDLQSHFGS
jgi:Polyketide cyclase / dehydrase and lipid transport